MMPGLRNRESLFEAFSNQCVTFAYQFGLQSQGFWWFWHGFPAAGGVNEKLVVSVLVFLSTVALCGVAIEFATRGLARTWRPAPDRPFIGVRAFRWLLASMRAGSVQAKNLDANPFRWLQEREAEIQFGRYLCVAAATVFSIWRWTDVWSWRRLGNAQIFQVTEMMFFGCIAFSAIVSFRAEFETGLLENLVITPLELSSLVLGRLQALLRLWLPTAIIFTTVGLICELDRWMPPAVRPKDPATWQDHWNWVWWPVENLIRQHRWTWGEIDLPLSNLILSWEWILATFLAGICSALRYRRLFLAGFAVTAGLHHLAPFVRDSLPLVFRGRVWWTLTAANHALAVGVAIVAWRFAIKSLAERRFAMEPARPRSFDQTASADAVRYAVEH
jgi:hypothetical protein